MFISKLYNYIFMNGSVFNKINDFTYGDFSIVNEKLFFKGKKIASEGKIIFSSSEEVFFLFNVEDEEVKKKFEKVIFLNFYQPRFFVLGWGLKVYSNHLQFITKDEKKYAFRRISYQGQGQTKVIGDKFF